MKKFRLIAFLFSVLLWTGCCDEKSDEPSITILSQDIDAGALMDLNGGYVFYYEATQALRQAVWTLEIPTESGEIVTIAASEATAETPDFAVAFPEIPNREDYLRTEASGMLDARVRLTGSFASGAPANGEFKVELPYRPAKPTLEVCDIEDDLENWYSIPIFCFKSAGVTSYVIKMHPIISYSHVTYGISGEKTTFIFPIYFFMDIPYTITIQSSNQYGKSETEIQIGGDENYYEKLINN